MSITSRLLSRTSAELDWAFGRTVKPQFVRAAIRDPLSVTVRSRSFQLASRMLRPVLRRRFTGRAVSVLYQTNQPERPDGGEIEERRGTKHCRGHIGSWESPWSTPPMRYLAPGASALRTGVVLARGSRGSRAPDCGILGSGHIGPSDSRPRQPCCHPADPHPADRISTRGGTIPSARIGPLIQEVRMTIDRRETMPIGTESHVRWSGPKGA
jgi:hypothetical protein